MSIQSSTTSSAAGTTCILRSLVSIVAFERVGSSSHWTRKSWAVDPLRNAICGGAVVVAMVVVMVMPHFLFFFKKNQQYEYISCRL